MAAKLRRNCASYEALDLSTVTQPDAPILRRWIIDAQADIGALSDATHDMLEALKFALEFMSGFEHDELQVGINERLAIIRNAIATGEALHA